MPERTAATMRRAETLREFPPLTSESPVLGRSCPVCDERLAQGDTFALLPLGPDNAQDRDRRDRGAAYTARAVPIHWRCRP